MDHPKVTSLYKYRAFNKFAIESIKSGTIWLSNPDSFNDPFDCSIDVIDNLNPVKLRELFKLFGKMGGVSKKYVKDVIDKSTSHGKLTKYGESLVAGLLEHLPQTFRDTGVFCLCEIPNDILMWSHYGDQHKGFCVGYNRTENNILGKDFVDSIVERHQLSGFEISEPRTKPVIYSISYPEINFSEIFESGVGLDKLWLTKSIHWSYEKEWRIVIPSWANKAIPMDAEITSIVFGLRMPKEHRNEIIDILGRNSSINFFQAVKDRDRYALNIVDF